MAHWIYPSPTNQHKHSPLFTCLAVASSTLYDMYPQNFGPIKFMEHQASVCVVESGGASEDLSMSYGTLAPGATKLT
eukprot:1151268-Pelagomonas_calceolata.AAC.4